METITIEQGLPSNGVNCLIQDHQGFIWIGTNDGLCRYDGYGFKVYRQRPGDSLSLPGNTALAIFEDHEHLLWVGTPQGLCLFDPLQETFTRFVHNPNNPNTIGNNAISVITEDPLGQLWIGTGGAGINLFDRKKRSFQKFYPDTSVSGYKDLSVIYSASKDHQQKNLLWIAARIGEMSGVYAFDTREKVFTAYPMGEGSIHDVYENPDGTLWVGSEKGVLIIDKKTRAVRLFDGFSTIPNERVTSIRENRQGNIWILAHRQGLFEYDPVHKKLHLYAHDPSDPNSLANNLPMDVLEDKSGVVWIGTMGAGVNRWRREKLRFQVLKGDPSNPRSTAGGFISSLCEDGTGRLWIGHSWKGVDCYNRKSGQFEPIDFKPGDVRRATVWIFSLAEDQDGRIWMGTNGRGLYCLDPKTRTYKVYLDKQFESFDYSCSYIRSILVDHTNQVWAGTFGGLYKFDRATDTWIPFHHDPSKPNGPCSDIINQLYEGRSGAIWVASQRGLSRMDQNAGTFQHYLYDPTDSMQLRSGFILNVCEDQQGYIWAGSVQGVYRLAFSGKNSTEPLVVHYAEKDGLLSNYTCGLLEDGRGRLWISSQRGLTVFKNPHHDEKTLPVFQHYNVRDGLQGYSFVQGAFFKNQQGEMFFGGENGYNVFHPDSIRDNPHIPQMVITDFKKYDVDHPEWGGVSVPGASVMEQVELSYKNNIITIYFAGLDFRDPSKNRYAYQMEGFNNNWIQLGAQHQVTFTNLDPGTYVFKVKGSNDDGVWSEQPALLKIIVHPPWYRSWLAYLCYLTLILGGIYYFYQYQLRRKLEQAEAERLKSLDEFKSRFFTNITHEFRTPLTVILGMTEQLSAGDGRMNTDLAKNSLKSIKRSGENLLRLISQILDLAKLESNSLKIHYVQGDLLAYLRYITESLQSLANAQNLMLWVESEYPKVVMDYDPERMLEIVHNLLSNAIKFTPSGGKITVRLSVEGASWTESGAFQPNPSLNRAPMALLSVTDTGVGVPATELPHLFDRFFQAKNQEHSKAGGAGIGLSFTRELVRAMGGQISVESPDPQTGKGTVFHVRLPLYQEAVSGKQELPVREIPQSAVSAATKLPYPPTANSGAEQPQLLIIEDNPDVVEYLTLCLGGQYQLDFAYNGRAGIEKALEIVPDLIISDVMMPEKDGFEVCDTLKNHEFTSHIPLVLLTAKADMESRIAGLRRGADAYLAKPFHQEELSLTLRNMMGLKQRLQAHVANQGGGTLEAAAVDGPGFEMEDAFVQKVRDAVEANLSNANFTVDNLCRALAMSQPQLHRKLTALTGKNATLFMRSIRLTKAKALLQEKNRTVSEVAYEIGFDDPKYFSRVFAEEFGIPPSKF